jgi:hypothetical protein
MTHRPFVLPKCVLDSEDSKNIGPGTIFVAFSDMHGRFPVTFHRVTLKESQRRWNEYQYDRESGNGEHTPRDMIFGFVALGMNPFWKTKGGAQKAFENFTSKQWKGEPMQMPPLDQLPRLKGSSYLVDGMWIVLVRTPRPVGCRNVVPWSRRQDVARLELELKMKPSDYVAAKLAQMRDKARFDTHPTDAQLFLTRNCTLVQGVGPNIVCVRCHLKGHHMSHVHDDVFAPRVENIHASWPAWMNVQPLPDEKKLVPEWVITSEDKGFQVEVQEAQVHVPLRLARQMKLRGMDVKGTVEKCGVMEVD